ncbi:hypothetical protein LJC14_00785 [Treponema sp. OttesenSCG-928-L16]|nr:hypothetical protein [Treponema sp. OttesenSCG-928-L16]
MLIGLCSSSLSAQARSFDDLYPGLEKEKKEKAFSSGGIIETADTASSLRLAPPLESNISTLVLVRSPSFIVETLRIIPYSGGSKVELLSVYNALSKVKDLKGRMYDSASRDREVPLFEEATRVDGPKRSTSLSDPPDASAVPAAETIYLKLKDVNFGNSYYRADIERTQDGLLYTLSNYKNLTYTFIPVIKEEKLIARIYIEPLEDGLLVYSIAGADVSDFIASRIHMPSAIQKRISVFIDWMLDGVR